MYKLTKDPSIVQRLSDEAFIPSDERNIDFREYLAWIAAGNKPSTADESETVIKAAPK